MREPPEVLYDFNRAAGPGKGHAAPDRQRGSATGEIENMRPVLESNELKPMVAAAYIADPIGHWKKESADGTGARRACRDARHDVVGLRLNGQGR